jgi:electron transport complex protein RnfB
MHSVIESECTGCELCIEPCPVDCIDLVRIPDVTALADAPLRQHRRRRYENRRARLAGEVRAHSASRGSITTPMAANPNAVPGQPFSRQRAREEIARAVERVRIRRQAKDKPS